jgi:hypothetical protein
LFELRFDGFLIGADVAHHPLAARTLDFLEVHDDQASPGFQSSMNRFHRLERKLEMMIGIADESDIHLIRWEPRGIGLTYECVDILLPQAAAGLLYMLEERRGNIDGNDSAFPPHGLGKQAGEQSGTGTDIGNRLPGRDTASFHNGRSSGEDFAAFDLESSNEFIDRRIEK